MSNEVNTYDPLDGMEYNKYGTGAFVEIHHLIEAQSLLEKAEARVKELEKQRDAIFAVLKYSLDAECPVEFLNAWMYGEFDAIRKEWPDFDGYLGEVKE